MSRLPPLKTLPSFLTVAKHKSFSKAADELCVTHSAVSQNIKQLETFLNKSLFNRTSRNVELTTIGQNYYEEIAAALSIIDSATTKIIKSPKSNALNFNVISSLAMHWLIPRIGDFYAKHPEINLRISSLQREIDFADDDIDMALVYGEYAEITAYKAEELFADSLILVAQTELAKQLKSLELHEIIQQNTCIYVNNNLRKSDWPSWCKHADVTEPDKKQRLPFGNTLQALQACSNGLGVLVTHKPLIIAELQSQQLSQISNIEFIPEYKYYLTYPQEIAHYEHAMLFRDWLLKEANKLFKNL